MSHVSSWISDVKCGRNKLLSETKNVQFISSDTTGIVVTFAPLRQVLWEMITREVPFNGLEGLQVAWLVVEKNEVFIFHFYIIQMLCIHIR